MKTIIFWILLFSTCLTPVAAEVEIDDLFEIEVMARSRSNSDRKTAISKALTLVLGRILSTPDALNSSAVSGMIEGAEHYVKHFQYAILPKRHSSNPDARRMRVLFDEQQILSVLRLNKMSIWGDIRPSTLIWLAIDVGAKRHFFHPESAPEIENMVLQAAKQKSLPVIFPMLDLKEQQLLSVDEVLSNDPSHLLFASDRYDVVSVVAGRLSLRDQCWTAEWVLHFDEKIHQWATSGCHNLQQITQAGIQGLYDVLASFYSVKSDADRIRRIRLNVAGIQTTAEMTRIIDYLTSIDMVSSAKWIQRDNAANTLYEIEYQGNQYVLAGQLAAGNLLRPVKDSGFSQHEMRYQLSTPLTD